MSNSKPQMPEVRVEKSALPNGMSFNTFLSTIRDAAELSIKSKYSGLDDYPGWMVDIYEDFLIYYLYAHNNEPGQHLKSSWKIEDGKIVIGEWVEVIELTQFVEIRKNRWQQRGIFDSLL